MMKGILDHGENLLRCFLPTYMYGASRQTYVILAPWMVLMVNCRYTRFYLAVCQFPIVSP
jgi:hypothetical protein